MKPIKRKLIELYGTRCMICGKVFGQRITWHHIIPKYAGGKDTLQNGSLLCLDDHRMIHQYNYKTAEYTRLTKIILKNKGQ